MATKRLLRLLPALLLSPAAGGCVWPMDPVPTWELEIQGTVTRAGTGAPVAGARVEVWLTSSDQVGLGPPFVAGQTDAYGDFVLAGEQRARALPAFTSITVTPPAGSGLAPERTGGLLRDVSSRINQVDDHVTYRIDIVLEPAP